MGFEAVPTEEPAAPLNMPSYDVLVYTKKKKEKKKKGKFFSKKSFWICCSSVDVRSSGEGEKEEEVKKEKEKDQKAGSKLKRKTNMFLCCSNVEFETKDLNRGATGPQRHLQQLHHAPPVEQPAPTPRTAEWRNIQVVPKAQEMTRS
ncbi:hypothetical protein CJ030_MR4G023080 [Morella rubra]|uniref:Uncharacterized protein n=1 Tax=Morella rubra TaxID=262757 RepID=A0A6A1VXB0_9ROSI|nr:hypothetical protein CJ030_MR4G023080 [Morella rubra]